MILVEANDADTVWRQLVSEFQASSRFQDSRNGPTKELLHVVIRIDDPRQRVVFARPINPSFAIAEIIWILAGSDDVSFLKFWNHRMKQYSDDGTRLCGAYGYRLGSQPGLTADLIQRLRHWSNSEKLPDQLRMAYEALTNTPHSRQAVLQIWNSQMDMPNPNPKSKDIPCNLVSHLLVRDGKLEWLQVMRSNDFFWGLPYNIIQFTTLQEVIAGWLGLDIGSYVHISDSLHAYERHWKDFPALPSDQPRPPHNEADLRIRTYGEWERVFRNVVESAVHLTDPISAEDLIETASKSAGITPAYVQMIYLLAAEALRRRGHLEEAERIVDKAGPYWSTSWRQWAQKAGGQKSSAGGAISDSSR